MAEVMDLAPVPESTDYVPRVTVTPEQAAENFRRLQEIKRTVMRAGVDYATIPGTDKPTLLKPGAEHLLQFFGLTHEARITERVMDWENGFFYFEAEARVYKWLPDGRDIQLASCTGSANSKESRYRNQNVYSIVNTLQKMAIKRALVGATLQATGTSGDFSQDSEDMDHAAAGPQRGTTGRRGGPKPRPQDAVAEAKKRLWALLHEAGADDAQAKAWIDERTPEGGWDLPSLEAAIEEAAALLTESPAD